MGSTAENTAARLAALRSGLRDVLSRFPQITLALVFGSVATGRERSDSDLDIAIEARPALSAAEQIALIQALAEHAGRPVDLIDLDTAPQPLLGQIVHNGVRILGSSQRHARLIQRNFIEQADFVPYRNRLLAERRMAWIGK